MKKNKYDRYSRFLHTLSGRKRFSIARVLLDDGPMNVTQICRKTGFEQSTVSHHLRGLASCQYVFLKPDGKQRVYSLNEDTLVPLLRIIDRHVRKYCKNCSPVGRK